MQFPEYRPRRTRRTDPMRRMARETRLTPDGFVYPLLVVPGKGVRREVPGLPDQHHLSVDKAVESAREAWDLGVPAVILFGLPEKKDVVGSEAWDDRGVVQRAIRELKKALPELVVCAEASFTEYTTHGQPGVLVEGELDNDASLDNLGRVALSYAKAGVDIVAPSGMLDGFVGTVREALDEQGHDRTAILACSAEYDSSFCDPFRDAGGTPRPCDRRGSRMDPANTREALREITLDVEEGADIILIRPALAYLDVIARARDEFDLPLAAHSVPGEYAMLEAAAEKGWIDRDRALLEALVGIRRAGADLILTHHAKAAARLLAKAGS